VNISQNLVITFNESMNHSATEGAIALSPFVALTPSWTGNSLSLSHTTPFKKSTTYTLNVTQNAKDLAGNPLDKFYSFKFSTEVAPPPPPPPPTPLKVLGTTPIYGATNVSVKTSITILFDQDVDKNSLKWNIFPSLFATAIVVNKTVTLVPYTNLSYNASYTLTIFKDTKAKSGGKMDSDYMLTFTTEKETNGQPPTPIPQIPLLSQPLFWFMLLVMILIVTVVLILIIARKGKKKEETVQATPTPSATQPLPQPPSPPTTPPIPPP
jgi:hypothetical protein